MDNLILRQELPLDGNGHIFVADTNNARIEKFAPSGTFLGAMGIKGTGLGQLGAPNGIAVDPGWQHLRGRRYQASSREASTRRQCH